MYGLLVGIGDFSARISLDLLNKVKSDHTEIASVLKKDQFFAISFKPTPQPHFVSLCHSNDGQVSVLLDGYIILRDTIGSKTDHLQKLANEISREGVIDAMKHVVSGAFNIVISFKNGNFYLLNDILGSIPIFSLVTKSGHLLSTNIDLILRLKLVDKEVDLTALAEIIYFNYTLNNRTPVKNLNQLPPSSIVYSKNQSTKIEKYGCDLYPYNFDILSKREILDQLSVRMQLSCERISSISGLTANLQSAGFDSRLITATWPDMVDLKCFTYGNYDSVEVAIAKMVADKKGSGFVHVRPKGDEIANNLENIFKAVDNFIYPDRYFISMVMAKQGYNSVLDGYLGDVVFGGTYFTQDKFVTRNKYSRFITTFRDYNVSVQSLGEISEALYKDMLRFRDSQFHNYFNKSVSKGFIDTKPDILNDIYLDVESISKHTDSLAILFRSYKIANRARMAIVKQGSNCRQFVEVFYPFTNDYDLIKYAFSIPPSQLSFRRLYIELYKTHFEKFANIPIGSSKLPLKQSSFLHKWSMILSNYGFNFPFIDAKLKQLKPSPNNWAAWLDESEIMRVKTTQLLSNRSICNLENIENLLTDISLKKTKGNGKLYHIAAAAKWLD